jgi:hypothetical protein
MGRQDQFKKWQLVNADIRARGSSDPRPESYSPDPDSLQLREVIDSNRNWTKRRQLIEPLIGATTTCELIAANRAVRMNEPAPSLGLIKPRGIKVELLDGKPRSAEQLAKVKAATVPDLFNVPLAELQPPPFRIRYHYKCQSTDCRGHRQEVLDWELGVSGVMWRRRYGANTGQKLLEKWTSMVADTQDVHFFVGNQHQYRQSFSVLGVWYPKRAKG